MMRTFLNLSTCMVLILSLGGCLKTRAQLKGESQDEGVPVQVKEVQPQGGYVIDELKSEITRLNGRIEDLERERARDGAAGADQKKVQELENRLQEMEQAQAALIEAMKKQHASAPPANPDATFDSAKSAYASGNYDQAVELFTSYLKTPSAPHAEEATFLRGEAQFNLKQYKKAIVDYSKFPEKYSKSKRMPAALFKIGLSFEALGMKEDAKSFYQEIVDRYPKSAEARKAKTKLK